MRHTARDSRTTRKARMNSDIDAILNPAAQQDDFTRYLRDMGYSAAKRLPDGSYAALTRLLTTTAICLGVDGTGWARRFCYQDTAECIHAWQCLQTRADEPTGWIARRPTDQETQHELPETPQ